MFLLCGKRFFSSLEQCQQFLHKYIPTIVRLYSTHHVSISLPFVYRKITMIFEIIKLLTLYSAGRTHRRNMVCFGEEHAGEMMKLLQWYRIRCVRELWDMLRFLKYDFMINGNFREDYYEICGAALCSCMTGISVVFLEVRWNIF